MQWEHFWPSSPCSYSCAWSAQVNYLFWIAHPTTSYLGTLSKRENIFPNWWRFLQKKLKLSPKIWGRREKLYWLLIMPDKMWIWRMKRSGIKWNEPEIISNEVFFGGRYILLKYLTYKYVKVCTAAKKSYKDYQKIKNIWILDPTSSLNFVQLHVFGNLKKIQDYFFT